MSLTKSTQDLLLDLARQSIAYGLHAGRPLALNLDNYPSELRAVGASFVTLESAGQLRGCIGRLEAVRPLLTDVVENAFAAAFRDRRFPHLRAEELSDLEVHISLLSPSREIHFNSEAELIAELQPDIDGLIIQADGLRATFLPAVWEDLPDPQQFLRQLKQKAGLSANYWSSSLRAYRYSTESFG